MAGIIDFFKWKHFINENAGCLIFYRNNVLIGKLFEGYKPFSVCGCTIINIPIIIRYLDCDYDDFILDLYPKDIPIESYKPEEMFFNENGGLIGREGYNTKLSIHLMIKPSKRRLLAKQEKWKINYEKFKLKQLSTSENITEENEILEILNNIDEEPTEEGN